MSHLSASLPHIPESVFARLGSLEPGRVTHHCPYCGKEILPRAVQQGYIPRECVCEREQRYRAQDQVATSYVRRDPHTCYTWLGNADVERGLTEKSFENFSPLSQDLDYALTTVQMWAEQPEGTLLLHSEQCGVGKTHLVAALCNAYTHRGKACLFTTGINLFNAITSTFDGEEKGNYQSIRSKLFTTPLLVIDDVDKARFTGFRGEVYFEVIDKRVNSGLPMALTTRAIKTGLADLEEYLGHDVVSRLQVGLMQIEVKGKDYRKNFMKRVK